MLTPSLTSAQARAEARPRGAQGPALGGGGVEVIVCLRWMSAPDSVDAKPCGIRSGWKLLDSGSVAVARLLQRAGRRVERQMERAAR